MNYQKVEQFVFTTLTNGLDKSLHYHGLHHTKEVIDNVIFIAENEKIDEKNLVLLKVAALLHDVGFTKIYNGHEEVGCEIAREILPSFELNNTEIDQICGMIMATRIPQKPQNLLEEILADADLMYLGTDKFEEIGNTLFEELKENKKIDNEVDWNRLQANFLINHRYHTKFCVDNFTQKKEANLTKVNNWLLTIPA